MPHNYCPSPLEICMLFVTSEMHPFIKTGGLADVSSALPAALQRMGVEVKVLLPAYRQVKTKLPHARPICTLPDMRGEEKVVIRETFIEETGVTVLLVDYPAYYDRPGGPYQDEHGQDWHDNLMRFALLSKCAALLAGHASPLDWHPSLVHCNDWQTGLTPAYLHFWEHRHIKSVMTIHNLAYQGIFPSWGVTDVGLPESAYGLHGVEYYGNFSLLKAGLNYADHITTVSPTYAQEIQTDELGFGMQGLLQHRQLQLTGIVNGIDVRDWCPANDHNIPAPFSLHNLPDKALNKAALQRRMGLEVRDEVLLIGAISRLAHQKGLDVLLQVLPRLLEQPVQLALLGSGEQALEQGYRHLAAQYPGKVAAHIGFDESLSHLIEAGADVFAMPSRFEPCGLNQMYSMRYGTPPIVNATGGLADTVVDAQPDTIANGLATGFVFAPLNEDTLHSALLRALSLRQDKTSWEQLQRNGMNRDFSWDKSAAQYVRLYQDLLRT